MDRSEQELNIIEQISQILGGGLELAKSFSGPGLLERELSIERRLSHCWTPLRDS